MRIDPANVEVQKSVKSILAMILSRHPAACATCEALDNCKVKELAYHYKVRDTRC
jgi:NADH dehydrogenase/NADH:ubiquinone oxidoreductase subunit G